MKIPAQAGPARRGISRAWAVLLILPALIYLPGILGQVPYPSVTAPYTDLLVTHYPYALVLKDALLNQGVLPLWSSLIYAGAPFAANPLAGVFYLPGWLALAFPLPAGISLVLALHAVFGSVGFYLWSKQEGCGEVAALAGSLAFGLMPKLAAHYGGGHVTLLYAISWTPWLFLTRRRAPEGWLSGVTAGLLFLADPRWAVFAGLLWVTYNFAHRQFNTWREEAYFHLKAALSAFLISAPLAIPLLELSSFSTRSTLTTADMLAGSLPPGQLLGLILPGSGGNLEWVAYCGGGLLALFLTQLAVRELRVKNYFWSCWAGLSIFIALGGGLSGADWLAKIPVLSLIRVPARALLITGFSLAAVGASTIQALLDGRVPVSSLRRVAVGLLALAGMLAGSLAWLVTDPPPGMFWGLWALGGASLVLLYLAQKMEHRGRAWILAAVLILELFLVGRQFIALRDRSAWIGDYRELEGFFASDPGEYRIYSPSYSIPQDLAGELGWELADGVDPLQLQSYQGFMERATGVAAAGYFVSIPPFQSGQPDSDNRDSLPDLAYLGLLNVKYIVSEFEIEAEGLIRQASACDCFIYANQEYLPRSWVVPSLGNLSPENAWLTEPAPARVEARTPNSIMVSAHGPGRLVLSEIYYPGWSAAIDLEPAQIKPAFGLLRSVELPPGEHRVVFRFQPLSVYAGLLLAAGGWVNLVLSAIRKRV